MTASLKQRNFLLAIFSTVITALLFVLVVPQYAKAREFSPDLNVELTSYGEGPFGAEPTAGGAPGMKMTLSRDGGEQFIKDFYMKLPLRFRVNQLANVERCPLPSDTPAPGWLRHFQDNCPTSDAGDVVATLINEQLPDLTGKIYVVNARQFFSKEENQGLRDEFIGSQGDLDENSEQQLPVVFYLVIGNRVELANSAIPMFMRTSPNDNLRIEVFMREMPPELQVGLRSMVASLYAAPTAGGNLGKSAGLLRTPPRGCEKDHVFEGEITSWADPEGLPNGKPEQKVSPRPKVRLDGCGENQFPYGPGMTYTMDTTDAGQSPTLSVNMTRTDEETATTGLNMRMPAHVLGSPLAAFPCTSPNFEVAKAEDVCPASTLVGDVAMKATLFDNEDPIGARGRVFIFPTEPGDLITLGVAFKMPPIAGNKIYLLKTGLSVYGDLEGVEANLRDMPPEFSIIKIDMSFFGQKGSEQSPPHPLLLLPSDCSPAAMSVDFESEIGQHSSAERPFQPTGCDQQPFDAGVSVSPTTIPPQSVPEVNIETSSAFRAATMKNLRVLIPGGFTVNRQGGLTPCSQEAANQRSCGPESLVAEVEAETPLLEPLTGKAYIVNPPADRTDVIKQMQVVIDPPAGLEDLTIDLRGELVKNPDGAGFMIVMKDMPQVAISKLKMKMPGGKDKGLLETPLNCGVYNYKAQAESHSGKTIEKTLPITIDGPGCEPRLIARVAPKNPKAKSKLQLTVVPNKGKANLRRVEIGLGKGKGRQLSVVSKGKKRKSGKKKRKSRKASTARRSSRSKRGGTSQDGSIELSFLNGRKLSASLASAGGSRLNIVASGKCTKKKKRKCIKRKSKSIGALGNVKLQVTKGKVVVSGLQANKPIRQLRIELGSEKGGKLSIRNPGRSGNLNLTGRYLHENGDWTTSSAKVRISGKARRKSKG